MSVNCSSLLMIATSLYILSSRILTLTYTYVCIHALLREGASFYMYDDAMNIFTYCALSMYSEKVNSSV